MTNKNGFIPSLVLTYGASGSGKTTDCGYSFPNALFMASRGALQSIIHTCGYEPQSIDVPDIQSATKAILDIKDKGYDAIVVDDFSFLAEKTIAQMERKHKGFHLWSALRDATIEFRNAARYAGIHVILNCWEQAPKTKSDGSYVRGGPMLSGKLPEQLPAMCDLVLRCGKDMHRKPWSGTYKCELSNQYVMKDRFGVAYVVNPCPMNMGEIMRAVGQPVSRLKGLEWQEEVVEAYAQEMLTLNPQDYKDKIEDLYKGLITNGVKPNYARWTIRDVLDRSVIRRAINSHQERFFA